MAIKQAIFAAAAGALLAAATPAHAVYPDKDIKFIIPFSTGGGFDVYVRMIAPFVEKHLPNKVNVVPTNMDGAGSRRGTAFTYRAKPDGYTIFIANIPGAAIPPILGEKVEYDLSKMTWISRLSVDTYLLGVSGKSPIKSIAELKARSQTQPIKMPSVGHGTTVDAMTRIFLGVLGIRGEIVTGYKGTKEMTVALIRGDIGAATLPDDSTLSYIQANEVRPLITTADPSPYKDAPSAKSAGFEDLDGLGIQRLVGGPPGIPDDIRTTLENAFLAAMKDPALVAMAEKSKRPFAPLTAAQAKQTLDRQLKVYLSFKDELAKK